MADVVGHTKTDEQTKANADAKTQENVRAAQGRGNGASLKPHSQTKENEDGAGTTESNVTQSDASAIAGEKADRHQEAATEENQNARTPLYKRPLVLIIAAAVLLTGAIIGLRYYIYARAHESTDDAFIESDAVEISPKVSGHVMKVYVADNQQVKAGDLLIEIDPSDYEVHLKQAQAALDAALARHKQALTNVNLTKATTRAGVTQASSAVRTARANVQAARAAAKARLSTYDQAGAQVKTAQAAADQARAELSAAEAQAARDQADVARYQELYGKDEISRQRLDQAIAAARTSSAQVEAARKRISAAEAQVTEANAGQQTAAHNYRQSLAQIEGSQSQVGEAIGRLNDANAAPQRVAVTSSEAETASADIEQARAAVEQAKLELSDTKIYAPEAGRVTKKAVDEGQLVQVGQSLMSLVYGDVWVVANFKETQLKKMQPGQPVSIKIDAYPDQRFKGHIDSFQSGTGARFSLLPPENATGNYVKVVQRVPVKILFDERPDRSRFLLAPGMSVEPQVDITFKPQTRDEHARTDAQPSSGDSGKKME